MSAARVPEHRSVRQVVPFFREQDVLFDRLERKAVLATEAASALAQLAVGPATARRTGDVATAIALIEAEGVGLSVDIEETLRRSLLLKMDRADLQALSRHLTEVCSLIARSVRTVLSIGLATSDDTVRLVDMLLHCTNGMAQAVTALRAGNHVLIAQLARELRNVRRRARIAHDDALAALLDGDAKRDVRELTRESLSLDDLKQTIGACGAMASFLACLAVKIA